MTKEQAILELMKFGYIREEATKFLDEPDKYKRLQISKSVRERIKKEHINRGGVSV